MTAHESDPIPIHCGGSGCTPGENSVEREVMRLRWWKAEAIAVLNDWERVWVALGRPGPLGASKAAACEAEVARLRLVQDSLLEQVSRMGGAS